MVHNISKEAPHLVGVKTYPFFSLKARWPIMLLVPKYGHHLFFSINLIIVFQPFLVVGLFSDYFDAFCTWGCA